MRQTGFERYFEKRMREQTFAAAYMAARADVASVDEILRQLEAARVQRGLTTAEVARRAGLPAEVVRRLFTAGAPDPTLSTVVTVARSLGLAIALVPWASGAPPP